MSRTATDRSKRTRTLLATLSLSCLAMPALANDWQPDHTQVIDTSTWEVDAHGDRAVIFRGDVIDIMERSSRTGAWVVTYREDKQNAVGAIDAAATYYAQAFSGDQACSPRPVYSRLHAVGGSFQPILTVSGNIDRLAADSSGRLLIAYEVCGARGSRRPAVDLFEYDLQLGAWLKVWGGLDPSWGGWTVEFGFWGGREAVDIDGDYAAFPVSRASGSFQSGIAILRRTAHQNWVLWQILQTPNEHEGNGITIDMGGGALVLGDEPSDTVFHSLRGTNGYYDAFDAIPGTDGFHEIGTDGPVVYVGKPEFSVGGYLGTEHGAILRYRRVPSGWLQDDQLVPPCCLDEMLGPFFAVTEDWVFSTSPLSLGTSNFKIVRTRFSVFARPPF
ncbi:MAG: hypothetical protein AAGK22_08605 [Acidobacteriota bacterium]